MLEDRTMLAGPAEIDKLTASDAAASDGFARPVAVSGDTVVVGVHRDDDAGNNSGSAYVFVGSGTTWSQEAKLTASDAAANDEFGWSIAVSGDTVVVGSRFNDDAGSNSGSAYVFVRSGTSWTEEAKLTAGDAQRGDNFAQGVAVSGDTVVVGARWDDDACPSNSDCNSGSAYVFTRSGTTWSQEAKLTASDAAADDIFGWSVAVSGDTIVVGAPLNDDAGNDSGSAYLFDASKYRVARPPAAIYTVIDNDSDGVFDDLGDAVKVSTRIEVGEVDSVSTNSMNRLVTKFALSDVPMDQLENATLRLYSVVISGTPAGPLSVFHCETDNDLDMVASDYENPCYVDTLLDLIQPTDPKGQYYELDVTDLVSADYAADGLDPLSAFRLEVSEAIFLEDNQRNIYRLGQQGRKINPPQLVLTFTLVPELIPGDVDGNGKVDFADFLQLSAAFGNNVDPPGSGADIDGNGRVEFADFLILAENFGESRQPLAAPSLAATSPPAETLPTANISAADDLFEGFDDELSLDNLL